MIGLTESTEGGKPADLDYVTDAMHRERLEAIELDVLFDDWVAEKRERDRETVAQWIAEYNADRAAAKMLTRHYRRALKALASGTFH